MLRFGEFKTKAGRMSPYFFNAGLFDDGAKLGRLAAFYARRLMASGIEFDMVFGPAYKGYSAGCSVWRWSWPRGRNVPLPTTAKEAKDHGEGGTLVGAPCKAAYWMVDDVMSAGTATRESIALIQAAGAKAHAVVIAAGPPGNGHRKRTWTCPTAPCNTCSALGLRFVRLRKVADLMRYLGTEPWGLNQEYQGFWPTARRYGVD